MKFIFENIGAIVAIIGLLYTTVTFVIKAVKNKNWTALISMVMEDMKTAEANYTTGADRKKWVMSMLSAHAKACSYPLSSEDIQKISLMIDELCAMSKVVNTESPSAA